MNVSKKSWEIGNLGYKIKNQRREINERLKQFEAKTRECEELKNKKKENEIFYLTKYTNRNSDCLEWEHKYHILKQALMRLSKYLVNFCAGCDGQDEYDECKTGCYYSLIPELKSLINDVKGIK